MPSYELLKIIVPVSAYGTTPNFPNGILFNAIISL